MTNQEHYEKRELAAAALARRQARVARVKEHISTALVLLGLGSIAAYFYLTFGYKTGILAIGVCLVVFGVGYELDREETPHGIRKGPDAPRA